MSKLKAKDPSSVEPSKPKILIFGRPNTRKTIESLGFPCPYLIDTEGGADFNFYKDALKKRGGAYLGPKDGACNFEEIINQIQALATEKHNYKTLIIDSVSKPFNNVITNESVRLGDKDAFGASKKPAYLAIKRLICWLDRLDMTVIMTAHEKDLWKDQKVVGETFDCYEKLEYELHLLLHIKRQGTSSKAYIRKTRLGGFPLDESFPWSYEEFSNRYGKEILEKEANPVVLANQDQVFELNRLVDLLKTPQDTIEKWLSKANAETFEEMTKEQVDGCIKHLKGLIK